MDIYSIIGIIMKLNIFHNEKEQYYRIKWYEGGEQKQIVRRYKKRKQSDVYQEMLNEQKKLIEKLQPIIEEKKQQLITKRKETIKNYYLNHKDKINEWNKEWNKELVQCDICNINITRKYIYKHKKTLKHQKKEREGMKCV